MYILCVRVCVCGALQSDMCISTQLSEESLARGSVAACVVTPIGDGCWLQTSPGTQDLAQASSASASGPTPTAPVVAPATSLVPIVDPSAVDLSKHPSGIVPTIQ